MIVRTIIAAMTMALLCASAYAQDKGPPTVRTDIEKKHDAEIDKAYRDALKRQGAAKPVKVDPWQDLRPASGDNAKR